MARMFTNSIYYVHEKSGMAELNQDIPVAQPKSIQMFNLTQVDTRYNPLYFLFFSF